MIFLQALTFSRADITDPVGWFRAEVTVGFASSSSSPPSPLKIFQFCMKSKTEASTDRFNMNDELNENNTRLAPLKTTTTTTTLLLTTNSPLHLDHLSNNQDKDEYHHHHFQDHRHHHSHLIMTIHPSSTCHSSQYTCSVATITHRHHPRFLKWKHRQVSQNNTSSLNHSSLNLSKEILLHHLNTLVIRSRNAHSSSPPSTVVPNSWEEWLDEHVKVMTLVEEQQRDHLHSSHTFQCHSHSHPIHSLHCHMQEEEPCIQLHMKKFHHFVHSWSNSMSKVEKFQEFTSNLDRALCSKDLHDLEYVKTVGVIHYFKANDQQVSIRSCGENRSTRRLTKKERLLKFVSSEEFGVACMMVCPPLLLAHWYGVYRKESLLLNCAQYVESGFRINLKTKLLHQVATLYKYPKSMKTPLEKQSQTPFSSHKSHNHGESRLHQLYPNTIILKSVNLEEILKQGLTLRCDDLSSSCTKIMNLKNSSFRESESSESGIYHVWCGHNEEQAVLCSFSNADYAKRVCQLLLSVLSLLFPNCEIPFKEEFSFDKRQQPLASNTSRLNSEKDEQSLFMTNDLQQDEEQVIHYHSFHHHHHFSLMNHPSQDSER